MNRAVLNVLSDTVRVQNQKDCQEGTSFDKHQKKSGKIPIYLILDFAPSNVQFYPAYEFF